MDGKNEVIIEVKNLTMHFNVGKKQVLEAVNNVSFQILSGETFGLVGESGCGKSTTGRTILGLYKATSGDVYFKGENIFKTTRKAEQKKFAQKIQMIFQDPYSSLNPRMTVSDIIGEGIDIHRLAGNNKERMNRIYNLLEIVGLNHEHANRYPHEFSGGQRQRIGIARALALEPEFIIADEAISALDVSVQAQIVNLMQQLQQERHITYLFIAHDLSMVKLVSDRIGVMYLGCLVELAESEELYENPLHPYTKALLSAIPIPDPQIEHTKERILLHGVIPSPVNPPRGCRFHTRCPKAMDLCKVQEPKWSEVKENHSVACHLYW